MPLFEFACRTCGHRFEHLTRQGAAPACPSCAGVDLEKQLSVFAARASSSSPGTDSGYAASGACGHCGDPRGPGSCSIN
jgi:putative FmdB family regulatory protein